jgi:hypothetical protein
MGIKLKNNAISFLAAPIGTSDTSLTLQPGGGAAFPVLSVGDYFYTTLAGTNGALEIVKVTSRNTDVLTVVRAQEGTTAAAFSAGSKIELRVTAASVRDLVEEHDEAVEISVADAGGYFAATNVEGVLQEIGAGGGSFGSFTFVDNFTGDGVTTAFTLGRVPLAQNLIDVFINGVYQEKTNFSFTGTTLNFLVAPPLGAGVEVVTNANITSGAISSLNVLYEPATGPTTNVETRLREYEADGGSALIGYNPAGTAVTFAAVDLVAGVQYIVVSSGLPSLGAVGSIFTATGSETGTGTARVYLTVQSKLRETVSVKDFGAVGDGVTDDTAAIQAAESFAYANNYYLNFGSGRYNITAGITLRCAFGFDRASYADLAADANVAPGFIPVGLSATTFAVTVQTQLGPVENLTVIGNTAARVTCRGVLFDNVQRAQVNMVSVAGLDGCGIEVRKCWDSTFTALSTLQCGNSTDYAVQITDGTGSTNECVFNHIQTEQAQVKGIYVSPNTYNCTFNVIHSEQVAGNGADYTHDIRGNFGCVWNSVRLTGTQVLVRLGSAGGVYNALRIEDDAAGSACQVNVEYAAVGYTTTITGGEIQGNLTVVVGNLANVVVNGIILGGAANITGNASSGLLTLRSCVGYVGSLLASNTKMVLQDCTWSSLTTPGGNSQVFEAYNTSFSGNYTQANDTNLIARDCAFAGTFSTGGGGSTFNMKSCAFTGAVAIQGNGTSWRSDDCDFAGGVSDGAGGLPAWCFGQHDRVDGTVTDVNATPPGSTGLKAGDTHWRPVPAGSQPAFWRWTGAAWLAGPNL